MRSYQCQRAQGGGGGGGGGGEEEERRGRGLEVVPAVANKAGIQILISYL